jgi:hypothetical protein
MTFMIADARGGKQKRHEHVQTAALIPGMAGKMKTARETIHSEPASAADTSPVTRLSSRHHHFQFTPATPL